MSQPYNDYSQTPSENHVVCYQETLDDRQRINCDFAKSIFMAAIQRHNKVSPAKSH